MVYPVSWTALCYITVITLFIKKVGVIRPNFGGPDPPPAPQWLRPCYCVRAYTDHEWCAVLTLKRVPEIAVLWWKNDISIGSAIFARLTAECRRACLSMSFPLIIAPSRGRSGRPSNTCFLFWAYLSPQRKRHLDWFICFCNVVYCDKHTDRPTDHATRSVTIGRIYLYVVLRCGLIIILTTTTSGQRNLTIGRIAAAHGRFNGIHQVAPH